MAERVYRMDRTTRIIIFIGLGMAVEVRRSRYAMMVNYEHMLTRSSWHSLFLSISVPRYSILIMDFSTSRSLGRSNSGRPCVSRAGNGTSAPFSRDCHMLISNRWLSIAWQFFWAWIYAPYRKPARKSSIIPSVQSMGVISKMEPWNVFHP